MGKGTSAINWESLQRVRAHMRRDPNGPSFAEEMARYTAEDKEREERKFRRWFPKEANAVEKPTSKAPK